ncbi:hypothetical protein NG798_16055 [Ancylothrix sp. C2]|uniref:hypothetical protein n=1 Tax=Ancylothrix sp. D3o TaxID=2953691 RepID=UPI0021BB297F|nr:hypothetical protein [Ancylothrix sp. D3o]MCT7951315.1 hypothetical protein [Ancylothrix sp. D3o]
MTPTLFGRWQTRLLLLLTVAVLITLPFFWGKVGGKSGPVFYFILVYVAVFGVGWDWVYNYLQKFRWDSDWPAVFQLLAGVWEGVFLGGLFSLFELPGVPRQEFSLGVFIGHYSCVWLGVFIVSQSLMRILFPRWRFKGGQWL